MKKQWAIRGARVVDPVAGTVLERDLFLSDGLLVDRVPAGAEELSARGLVIVPGLIDLHVHLREPGGEAAETVASGTAAAARGGFTTVVAMPNTSPAADSAERVRHLMQIAASASRIRVLPSGSLTVGRKGLAAAPIGDMAVAGAVAFSDDGTTVSDEEVMKTSLSACAKAAKPAMDHALDMRLAGKGVIREGAVSRRMGLPGIPADAEIAAVERDVRLARETGCAVHIQHVSAARTVEIITRARAEGLDVTCEVTPHHLALCDEDIPSDDANYKMNPPLGSRADMEALRKAAALGQIQAFATDHAPHPAADKAGGFLKGHFGVVGLETAIGVTYTTMVEPGMMDLVRWTRLWTTGPAAVIGLPPPSLAPGTAADLAVLDLVSRWTVDTSRFLTKSRNTPFIGMGLVGRARYTFCGGRMVWNGSGE